ncbi:MAG: integrase core domain-containing protein [Marmoricola sp.]
MCAPGCAAPGQNGSGERAFGTLKYERLYCEQIDDALDLQRHLEDYRTTDYNLLRPHEAIAWNRPIQVHLGHANPHIPSFHTEEILPTPGHGTPSTPSSRLARGIVVANTPWHTVGL